MNNQQRIGYCSLAMTLRLIILVVICNTTAAINSPAHAAAAEPSLNNIECLFNWAQTFYPSLFSPPVSGVQFFSPYTYRYYPGTNAYLGVSSADNHVHYLRPDGTLQDVGDLSVWLGTSGCGEKPYPVIFIHGIASSAETWVLFRDYLINNGLWTFGGIPAYNPATKTVSITCPADPNVKCTGNAGEFYTLNFSDNQGLSLDVQGGELAAIIKAVLDANPGKTKVLLVSHSMGVLAAREYLQGLARESNAAATMPYRKDVAKLLTVGAPHQGSFWAATCNDTSIGIPDITGSVSICDLVSTDVDPNSVAILDLKPDSSALNILNNLAAHPLPPDAAYVSIIATGQSTLVSLIDFKDGDGIVSDTDQDLKTVARTLPQQRSVRIAVPFQEECGNKINVPTIGELGETHTCETTDIGVGGEILRNLQ
jgi:triacylglycerol lipase